VGLHDDLEARLHEEAAAVQSHFEAHSDKRWDLSASSAPHELQSTPGTYVRLLGENGDVIRSSPAFQARPPLPVDLPAAPNSTLTRRWGDTAAKSLYVSVEHEASAVAWMEVTKLQSPIHRQLHDLQWMLVLGIGLGVGVAMLVGYGLAQRVLRPVASLTAAARELQDRPSGTLPTDFGVDDELAELAETFNELLAQLRAGLRRERRFRADAAHNMFTPLTAIQSEIDVTLRSDRSPAAYRDTLETVRTHTDELSGMLDRLMTLSRAEARERGPAPERINVAERVRERANQLRSRVQSKEIHLDVQTPDEMMSPIQAEHVDTVVDHLLDNAVKYTPEGGDVQVSVQQTDDAVVLRVADTGIGFDPDTASRLFDRFYRGPEADDTARGGGLGLSVVQALAHSYNGTVSARSHGPGTGSIFEVHLPLPRSQE
jgi:signal transduction histidine kinase